MGTAPPYGFYAWLTLLPSTCLKSNHTTDLTIKPMEISIVFRIFA